MTTSVTTLIDQLIKTIEDLFHHADFNTAATDLIATATDAVASVPEIAADIAGGPVALLGDAVNAAVSVAQTNILNKAAAAPVEAAPVVETPAA